MEIFVLTDFSENCLFYKKDKTIKFTMDIASIASGSLHDDLVIVLQISEGKRIN